MQRRDEWQNDGLIHDTNIFNLSPAVNLFQVVSRQQPVVASSQQPVVASSQQSVVASSQQPVVLLDLDWWDERRSKYQDCKLFKKNFKYAWSAELVITDFELRSYLRPFLVQCLDNCPSTMWHTVCEFTRNMIFECSTRMRLTHKQIRQQYLMTNIESQMCVDVILTPLINPLTFIIIHCKCLQYHHVWSSLTPQTRSVCWIRDQN